MDIRIFICRIMKGKSIGTVGTGSGIVRRTIRMPRGTSNSNYEVPLKSTKQIDFLTELGHREQRKR